MSITWALKVENKVTKNPEDSKLKSCCEWMLKDNHEVGPGLNFRRKKMTLIRVKQVTG